MFSLHGERTANGCGKPVARLQNASPGLMWAECCCTREPPPMPISHIHHQLALRNQVIDDGVLVA